MGDRLLGAVENSQADSVIERAHLTIGAILHTMLFEEAQCRRTIPLLANVPKFITTDLKPCKNTRMQPCIECCSTFYCASPGAFMFNCDMISPIQCFTSWEGICFLEKKTSLSNLLQENSRSCHLNWRPGQKVLISNLEKNKLQPKGSGPYTIDKVNTNGTVTLKKGNFPQK